MRRGRALGLATAAVLISCALAAIEPSARAQSGAAPARASTAASGIHKIKHVVIIMQENRSFDSYFGTYPGADGIPGLAGNKGPQPCMPDPHEKCVHPFHDRQDHNWGGPHHAPAAYADIDHGKMDGFIKQQEVLHPGCKCQTKSTPPDDVMGYHTGKELPNYWKYANHFVLQDHMFQPDLSWSLPAHLYMVSLWSARCTTDNPMSCKNSNNNPDEPPPWGKKPPVYAWTDLTYLLDKHHVSWRYYIFKGIEPDCESNTSLTCRPVTQGPKTLGLWNPLLYFEDVKKDHQRKDIQSLNGFFAAASRGKLPAVSWVIPNGQVSDHPPNLISKGQTYVTGLINTIMQSPDWKSTAIFLAWDDWSGFYDNVRPPHVDKNGYGLRVPALLISPYAKKGYIDHQTLSFDAYAKFIEDDFMGSQRINPKTDGRRDPRPDVREKSSKLGNLISEFNFDQSPLPPVILPVHPKTDLIKPK